MSNPIRDPYIGNGTPQGRVTFIMEWIWRVMTVIVIPIVGYMVVQVSAIQASVASLQARVLVLEERTEAMPPIDYRAYIDAKFADMTRRLDEIAVDVKTHIRNQQP